MKRLGVTGLLLLMGLATWAQQVRPIKFNEEIFDFGSVIEENGPVVHEFVFTNNSAKPVNILAVKPSCGCTTPDWTKGPVMPGKTGFVKAQFDPKGRPGYFSKSLTITTDFDNQPIVLHIKGQVSSNNRISASEFQAASGNLRFRSLSFNLGKVYLKDELLMRGFDFLNAGTKPISYIGKFDGPDHITVAIEPPIIQPGEKGTVKLSYNGKKKGQYGFQTDRITIYTNDELVPKKEFNIYATLEDYFAEMTPEELATAPQLRFASMTLDYGSMKKNQSMEREIQFANNGKSPLEIRSVQSNCSCIQVNPDKVIVKAGETSTFKVSFNPQDRGGTQTKAITIYSNDPQNPVQRITVTGVVN